jgi:hypothetical protein
MHEAESARALDTCARHRKSMPTTVKLPAGSSHRLFGTVVPIRVALLIARKSHAETSRHFASVHNNRFNRFKSK